MYEKERALRSGIHVHGFSFVSALSMCLCILIYTTLGSYVYWS